MTDHTNRNIEIIRAYVAGRSISDLEREFQLSRGRLYQILHDIAKVRRASERDMFLGVNVSTAVKQALKKEAIRRGISVSSLSSETLQEMLAACGHEVK